MEHSVPTSYPADGRGINYYSLKGKVVKFTSASEVDYEIYADEGMLARVLSVTDDSCGKDRMVKIRLDFDEFKEHNERLQKPNFYDNNGNPTLTWYESGLYEDGKDTIICMEDTEKYLPPFVPIDDIPITVEECLDLLKECYDAEEIGQELSVKIEKLLRHAKRIA